ncbi:Alpha/beta knot methyltransferase [Ochromonadaceae sp. CCMP2298]|nr:Alpha/beta knot methyltransferase [Ochromonadaceae sp. CCMP2298]
MTRPSRLLLLYLALMAALLLSALRCNTNALTGIIRPRGISRCTGRSLVTALGCWPDVEVITSESNSRVKLLKSLKLKKKRDELGLVLVEGHRMIVDAVNAGLQPLTVLYTDKAKNSPLGFALYQALDSATAQDVALLEVSESVLQAVGDTVTSQGVVAAFRKPAPILLASLPSLQQAPYLVLDNIADPGNMGTLIRSSYGLGCGAVLLVGESSCDPWSPKVLRAAMGLHLRRDMPLLPTSWPLLYKHLGGLSMSDSDNSDNSGSVGEVQVVVADSGPGSVDYSGLDLAQASVLVVGSEAVGVSAEAYTAGTHCKRKGSVVLVRAQIPMLRAVESFNAAVAGSILLAEAARQRGGKGI